MHLSPTSSQSVTSFTTMTMLRICFGGEQVHVSEQVQVLEEVPVQDEEGQEAWVGDRERGATKLTEVQHFFLGQFVRAHIPCTGGNQLDKSW